MSSVGLIDDSLQWFELGTLEPFMAEAIVIRPWMHCQGHVAHGTSRIYHSVSVSVVLGPLVLSM